VITAVIVAAGTTQQKVVRNAVNATARHGLNQLERTIKMTAITHDSHTCALNSGQPCSMCSWANEHESDQTTPPFPGFDDDWELAPLCHTRYVERATAEYWYHVGRQSKERELLTLQNADLREMLRVARERVIR